MTEHRGPMLLVPNEREERWQVYDVAKRKFSEAKLDIAHKMRFCGSSHGWLASVNHDYTMTLHRPTLDGNVAASTISLPPLPPQLTFIEERFVSHVDPYISPCEYHVNKICITEDPQLHAEDCIIFVSIGRNHELAFIRYNKDTTWTWITRGSSYEDMMWHNNRLYAVNLPGALECFEIPDDADKPVRKTIAAPSRDGDLFHVFGTRYLTTTFDKEILRIDRHFGYGDSDSIFTRSTTKIEVFKLDSRNNEWNKIALLGDATLFLGDNASILVRTSEIFGCRPNSVYLTQDVDYVTCEAAPVISDVGEFNLESQKLTLSFGLDPNTFQSFVGKPPIWIVI